MPDELQILAFLAIVAAFWVGGWGIVRAYLSGDRLCEDALRIFLVAVALALGERAPQALDALAHRLQARLLVAPRSA